MSQKQFKQHISPSLAAHTLPALYAIANIDELDSPILFVKDLLHSGIEVIQLRNKRWAPEVFLVLIEQALVATRDFPRCRIIINDSVELAVRSGAAGVHLGQTDGSISDARKRLGSEAMIGLSTHRIEDIEQSPQHDLSYLALGPIFASRTKFGHAELVGIGNLEQACKISALPIVAIGGITLNNAASIFAAGATSAAVIADLRDSTDRKRYAREFTEMRRLNLCC